MNRRSIMLMLILLTGLPPSLAAAGENSEISLHSAVSAIRNKTNGRILHAETIRLNGRLTHRIRLLTRKGLVRRIQIDARSGHRLNPPKRRR